MAKANTTRAAAAKNAPFAHGVGRRKSSVARVWVKKGKGEIVVNGKPVDQYFTVDAARLDAKASFQAVSLSSGMLFDINVAGGGYMSQAGAVRLGIARALVKFDETLKPELKKHGFISVDSRVKERKKYGQKGARRKFQFTKR
jgi:small subunit ribosomal protein S9